jgi:hypothetical protein
MDMHYTPGQPSPLEMELLELGKWAELVKRYRYYPYAAGDQGPVGTTDEGAKYISITTGRPSNAAQWQLDQGPDGGFSLYDCEGLTHAGTFSTLRQALEAIYPSD